MLKSISIIALFLLMTGCSPMKPEVVFTPPLNQIATAEVGQNMFSKVYAVFPTKEAAFLTRTEDRATYPQYLFYFMNDDGECIAAYEISGSRYKDELVDKNCDGFFTHKYKFRKELETPIPYKVIPAKPFKITKDAFSYEVKYQGRVGNRINIAFYELVASGDNFIVRNAFTQHIEYELDENGQALIGFRGLRIKVLKATNFDITYQVLNEFTM